MYDPASSSSPPITSFQPQHLPPHSQQQQFPRRAVSMPERSSNAMSSRMPFPASTPEVSYGFPSPHSPSRIARRLQYKIKSRGGRHVVPLTLVGLLVVCLIFFSGSSSSHGGSSALGSHARHGSRAQRLGRGLSSFLGSRSRPAPPKKQGRPGKDRDNGLSLLVQEEEELIAEDDLFWDKYEEELPRTEAQLAADADILAHKEDVAEQNRRGSLRALVWWLAEGGVIPEDWEVPSASYIRKIGARGMERLLEDIEPGYPDEPIFEDGWADYAKKRYRVVVFSKSYCPYSARAKGIIHQYHVSPAPFIIELDHRTDTSSIQSILEHLTGRRTVPNILMDFVSVGGSDDLTLMQSEGSLKRKFAEMELLPGSKRRPFLTLYDSPDGVAPAIVNDRPGAAAIGQQPDIVADRAGFQPDLGAAGAAGPDGLPAGKMRLPPVGSPDEDDEDDEDEDDEWDAWERGPTSTDDLPTRTDQDGTPLLQRDVVDAPQPPIMGGLLGDEPVVHAINYASQDDDYLENDDQDDDEETVWTVPPKAAGLQQPLVAPGEAMALDGFASPFTGIDQMAQPPMGNVAAAKAKVAAEAAARLAADANDESVVPLKQTRLEKLRDRARAAAAEKRKQELARLKKLSEQPAAAAAAAAVDANAPEAKKARKAVKDKKDAVKPKAKKAKAVAAAAGVPKRGTVLGAGAEVIHNKGRTNEGKKAAVPVAEKKKARVLA